MPAGGIVSDDCEEEEKEEADDFNILRTKVRLNLLLLIDSSLMLDCFTAVLNEYSVYHPFIPNTK